MLYNSNGNIIAHNHHTHNGISFYISISTSTIIQYILRYQILRSVLEGGGSGSSTTNSGRVSGAPGRVFRNHISIEFIRHFLLIGGGDVSVFLQIRWLVLEKVISALKETGMGMEEDIEIDGDVTKTMTSQGNNLKAAEEMVNLVNFFVDFGVNALSAPFSSPGDSKDFKDYSKDSKDNRGNRDNRDTGDSGVLASHCCTSWSELITARLQLAQWLLAFSKALTPFTRTINVNVNVNVNPNPTNNTNMMKLKPKPANSDESERIKINANKANKTKSLCLSTIPLKSMINVLYGREYLGRSHKVVIAGRGVKVLDQQEGILASFGIRRLGEYAYAGAGYEEYEGYQGESSLEWAREGEGEGEREAEEGFKNLLLQWEESQGQHVHTDKDKDKDKDRRNKRKSYRFFGKRRVKYLKYLLGLGTGTGLGRK